MHAFLHWYMRYCCGFDKYIDFELNSSQTQKYEFDFVHAVQRLFLIKTEL